MADEPPITPVHPDVVIVKMGPGQEIECDALSQRRGAQVEIVAPLDSLGSLGLWATGRGRFLCAPGARARLAPPAVVG